MNLSFNINIVAAWLTIIIVFWKDLCPLLCLKHICF